MSERDEMGRPPQGDPREKTTVKPQNPFRDEVPAARELAEPDPAESEQQRKEALTERD